MAFHHERIFKTRGLSDNLPKWKRIIAALVKELQKIDGAETYVGQVAKLNATFQTLPDDAPLEQYAAAALELVKIMEEYIGDDAPENAAVRAVYVMLEHTIKAIVVERSFGENDPVYDAIESFENSLCDLESAADTIQDEISSIHFALDDLKKHIRKAEEQA